MKERVATSLGDLLFAKAFVAFLLIIFKRDCYKLGGKFFYGYQWVFLVNRFVTFLFDCTFVKMILTRLKSQNSAS